MSTNPHITRQEDFALDGQFAALEHTTGDGSLLRIKDDPNSVLVRRGDVIHRVYSNSIPNLVAFLTETPLAANVWRHLPEFDIPPPPVYSLTITGPEDKDIDLASNMCVRFEHTILCDDVDVTGTAEHRVVVEHSYAPSGDNWEPTGKGDYLCSKGHTTVFFAGLGDFVQRVRVGIHLRGADRTVYAKEVRLIRDMAHMNAVLAKEDADAEPKKTGKYVVIQFRDPHLGDRLIPNVREVRWQKREVIILHGEKDTFSVNRSDIVYCDLKTH